MEDQALGKEHNKFRDYARNWLDKNRPPPPPVRLPISALEIMTEAQRDYLQDWQGKCYEAGLIGCDYPTDYGGGGHDGFQRIANREAARANVPFWFNIVGLGMAAPTILVHGTEEQKRKFIPGALSGAEIWCQGFSEPEAGSDMANQRTMAVRDGDQWVVNGHKVWTSLGHFAKWMILIARTSSDHKYEGLSYFLCPIDGHPGVTVRPLVKMTGESGFNEVFFDDSPVPHENMLGGEGNGWAVAMTTLSSERGASEGAGGGDTNPRAAVARLAELARNTLRDGRPVADDPVVCDAIVQHAIWAEGLVENARRSRIPALNDHPMRLALQSKVTGSEFRQSVARLGVEIAGPMSTLYKNDPNAPDKGHWPMAYMGSYGSTIAAGANEIQRNILGERVLGLPKTK
ncbi:MAG: acyl-CoA dehydrogenase [Actinomycetia bacterium]|nr:acyl-CoA dehydrogenase [Actinomycetes bacterium]